MQEDYYRISRAEIPIVVYNGDDKTLPDIFDRINSQGTPLSTYQICAASWPDKQYEIENDEVIEMFLKKYDELIDDNYKVWKYDREEIKRSKRLTIFQYVFGLSKYLNNKFPCLRFDKSPEAGDINEIAFELLDACLNDNKQVTTLYESLDNVNLNVNKLERRLIESVKFVQDIVNQIGEFKGNRRGDKLLHQKFQIISLISFVFREKYDKENLDKPKPNWIKNENNLKTKILLYYVYDSFKREWSEGGSNKVRTFNKKRRYYDEITFELWDSILESWYNDKLSRKETQKIKSPGKEDIIFLSCVYLKKFTAFNQLSGERFDIEHIAPKDQMKKLIKATNIDGLSISSIANLCYLPEYVNRSKKNNTFYKDEKYLEKVGLSLSEIEDKYSFTQKSDLDWIEEEYTESDGEKLRENYLTFLKTRFEHQKKEFYDALEIKKN